MTPTQAAMDLSGNAHNAPSHPTTPDTTLSPLSVALSASSGLLAWQGDRGRTPAHVLADAIERFTHKYGIAPTYAEVHPSWAHLTAPGLMVTPNRAVDAGTVRVGVRW
jgi:hypothetical protein